MPNNLIELGICNAKFYMYEEFVKFEEFVIQSNMKLLSSGMADKKLLEASCSALLAGANLPLEYAMSLFADEEIKSQDEWMVKGTMNATQLPIPQTLSDLVDVWNVITDHCYNGPQNVLPTSLTQWFDLWKSPTLEEHPVIKQLALHILFGKLKPFYAGNGRLGRLLLIYGLRRAELASIDYISLSEQILVDPDKYHLVFNILQRDSPDLSFAIRGLINLMRSAYGKVL